MLVFIMPIMHNTSDIFEHPDSSHSDNEAHLNYVACFSWKPHIRQHLWLQLKI